jgi:hypothetical protein
MSQKISEVFEIDNVPSTPHAVPVIEQTRITDDADYARANLRALIATAQTALAHALDVAVQSESPRAYEVLATFINSSADLNTKLIDIHQRESKMVAPQQADTPSTQNITNNVVFNGTTEELNNLIMKRMKK